MIRLCNDFNLIVPDKVIEEFFIRMKEKFNDGYQDNMSKSLYANNAHIREITTAVIEKFGGNVMHEMDTGKSKKFGIASVKGTPVLQVIDA